MQANDTLNVVFASAEAAPFVKTGGLGDVAGSLPQALAAAGAHVVVMVPKYDTIAQEYRDRMEHRGEFYVSLGWRNEYCGVERLSWGGVDYLFLDNEHYFHRGYPYGFFDDGERFAFFSKAITESLQHLPRMLDGFTCNVLHCNDWHTAMAPVFLREFYQGLPLYENVKTVFSIHNIAFQGQYSAKVLNDVLGMAHIPAAAFQLTCGPDAVNYMQGALNYTDAITTVSPTYAAEIQTPEFGEHLDGVLRRRSGILTGIVNGIDTAAFDPASDTRIAANYTAADRSGKAVCKARLQEELGLEVRDDRPLMVMVTRLTRQKGMDLVTYALDRILSGGVQVAVLGTGDTEYENALRYFEGRYRGTMAARIQFDPALSQRMYAGADLFLMPSLFEPCGLSQMIAMRYGTLPVVRETGGLADTVQPYNQFTGEGTGFTFTHFNGDEMADAVFRGARLFWDNKADWNKLVDNAMAQDFSWTRSAGVYMELYHNLHPEIPMPTPPAPEPEAKPEVEAPAKADESKGADDTEPERSEAKSTDTVKEPEQAATPAATATAADEKGEADQAEAETKPAVKPAAKRSTARKTTTRKPTAKTSAAAKAEVKADAADADAAPASAPATEAVAASDAKPAAKTTARRTATAKKPVARKTATVKAEQAEPVKTTVPSTAAATSKAAASTSKATTPKTASVKPAAAKAAAHTAATRTPAHAAPAGSAPKAATGTPATPKHAAPKASAPAASTAPAATSAPAVEAKAKTVRTAKPATRRKRS